MPMTVRCASCAKSLRLRDEWQGKRIRCPVCKEVFLVGPDDALSAVDRLPGRKQKVGELRGEALDKRMPESAPNSPPEGPLPFTSLGHYRVVRRIGRGGMGDVYLGYEESLGRPVALKVLPAEHAAQEVLVRRFRSEAAAVARLAHPNLVPVYFVGCEGNHHFFAMQYVEGESLDCKLSRQGRLEPSRAADVLENCLRGLSAAHQAGLVHRDVKPGNILIEADTGRALLADFGLVKLVGEGADLTRPGVILGTMNYLSPEQARGVAVDHRSDLYSLGVVAYRMLTGRLPFEGNSPSRILFQHAYEAPRPLREVAPELPLAFSALVSRLLAKEPTQRYSSCADVLDDLRKWRGEAAPVCGRAAATQEPVLPPLVPPQDDERTEALSLTPSSPRRRRVLVVAGAAALALLVVGLTIWLWPRHVADGKESEKLPPVVAGTTTPVELRSVEKPPEVKVPPLFKPADIPLVQAAGRQVTLCEGHENTVFVVAVSPGSSRLLSGSRDKSVRLWAGKTGKLLRSSVEPTYWVEALGFSPDGKFAVSPRDPSALRVWEVETGKECCQFTGHKSSVRGAAFSSDGRWVLSGAERGLYLWNAADGTTVKRLSGLPDSVACLALSQDNRWALSGGSAGSLIAWDLAAGRARPLAGHKGSALVAVGFLGNDLLVSADVTRMIRVWERDGRLVRQIEVHCEGPVQRVAFSPQGDRAACACEDETLRLIDLVTGKEIGILRGHKGGVTAVAFSPDGKQLASGGKDRTVRLWDLSR